AGGPMDRKRAARGDLHHALWTTADGAATAPTVPGAAPLGDGSHHLDAYTATTPGVVVPDGDPMEKAVDRALRDPQILQKSPDLAAAHDERRLEQNTERLRPDRPAIPAQMPDRDSFGTAICEALDPARTVPP